MSTRYLTTNLLVVIFLGLTVVACGQSARQKTLKASLVSLNASRDGFLAWDREHQQQIVYRAESLAEGRAALAAYHEKRRLVVLGFEIAYKGLATAALSPSETNVVAFLSNFKQLYEMLRELTGKEPQELRAPKD